MTQTSSNPWSWRTTGAFDAYSQTALHAATLSFMPPGTVLYGSFSLLDAVAVPAELLPRVWALRGGVTALLVAVTLWMRRRGPGRGTTVMAASMPMLASLSVVWMSAMWNRGYNDYGAGTILCMLAFGFLTRLPLHTLVCAVVVNVVFVAAHLAGGPLPQTAWVPFVQQVGFLVGAGVLAVLQAYTSHLLRHATFTAHRATELLNESLESEVLARTEQLTAANEAFLRFVPAEFLRELGYHDIAQARLGDAAARRTTILFADIRNFTTLSEGMTPEETFAFLNGWLSKLGPHIRAQSGFVDKYIGDAILALFPRGPQDAVRAAIAMQREIRAVNHRTPEPPHLAIGVGIHVGQVMMGTIGEAERFEATVISDAVNVTARLESLTKQLGCAVLVTDDVHAGLDHDLRADARPLGSFVPKGKSQAVALYEVFSSDPDDLRERKRATRALLEAMLCAFEQRKTGEATAVADQLASSFPDDGPVRWWREHLRKAQGAKTERMSASPAVVWLDQG